jgi:hypothetical protein
MIAATPDAWGERLADEFSARAYLPGDDDKARVFLGH